MTSHGEPTARGTDRGAEPAGRAGGSTPGRVVGGSRSASAGGPTSGAGSPSDASAGRGAADGRSASTDEGAATSAVPTAGTPTAGTPANGTTGETAGPGTVSNGATGQRGDDVPTGRSGSDGSDDAGTDAHGARGADRFDVTDGGGSDAERLGGSDGDGSDADRWDAAAGSDDGDVAAELARLRQERDEYLDALRRLQADFENYRKRVQRQQDESVARAAERLVAALLPALDAFDLAAEHLVGDEHVSPGGLLQAAALLQDILAKEGVERVGEAGDPFDPTAHEAVEHVEDEGGEGPVVDTVLRAGYRYQGRTVRPAMVKVRG
jgi:molecular chaperone GrpE